MDQPPLERAVRRLLTVAPTLEPDGVPALVAEAAREFGAVASELFLVDYEQRVLVSVADPPEAIDIDGSMAGRAYRTEHLVEAEADGVRKAWMALLDGADRLGVLTLTLAPGSPVSEDELLFFARLVTSLVVSKCNYGDGLERLRRTKAMTIAAELRWSMLPPRTFASRRVSVSGVLEPAYEIAGDCFDYAVNGDHVHLAILDAMGHGLEASRVVNLALVAYRHARRLGADLPETFYRIDTALADQFGPERFVTGQLAVLDADMGVMRWLNAGHPRPLLLRRPSSLTEVIGDVCLPLGLGDVPAEIGVVSLQPGDQVLFYTDGVIEAQSADGDLFGMERLGDFLVRAASAGEPPPETLRRLVHAVLAHEAGRLRDDATLLLTTWYGSNF
jgi:hypothetical protein